LFSHDEIQTLERLGLTNCQARIYLSIAHSGMITAKAIADNSKINREHVYRVLPTLQKIGLVEKVITRPIMFKAMSIEDAFSALLSLRAEETSKLQKKSQELTQRFKEKQLPVHSREPEFTLIPEKRMLIQRIKNAIERSEKCIDVIASLKQLNEEVHFFEAAIRKTLKKGVKTRIITEKIGNSEQITESLKMFRTSPCSQIKYIPAPPKAVVTIYDMNELFIMTKPNASIKASSALWSNHPSLLHIAKDYFDFLWITALDDPNYFTNGSFV
jgi:sugar-specific transcriptional regulator TrmB